VRSLVRRLEEVEVFAINCVIPDCGIATGEPHIANLSLSGVKKQAGFVPAVVIAVEGAGRARKDQNERVCRRSADSALGLASVDGVQLRAPIRFPNLERSVTSTDRLLPERT
jgi:hypothetical protein